MSTGELVIEDLRAGIPGREILQGLTLTVRSGEVHAVMGPNGSGKSTLAHVLMGRPGYEVLGGSVTLDGDRPPGPAHLAAGPGRPVPGHAAPHRGARRVAGRVAGRRPPDGSGRRSPDRDLTDRLRAEAGRIGFDERFLDRPLNVDLSGGERKRNETLQLGVLRPRFAVLDEIDSGLDVDALADVGRRVQEATTEWGLGVLAITHFRRLLDVLHPDVVHVLSGGRVVATGGARAGRDRRPDRVRRLHLSRRAPGSGRRPGVTRRAVPGLLASAHGPPRPPPERRAQRRTTLRCGRLRRRRRSGSRRRTGERPAPLRTAVPSAGSEPPTVTGPVPATAGRR